MAKTLVYQLYPIAWEQYGEGKNALEHMTKYLERIKALGVDYIWLSPIYPSPRCNHGYDITDYKRLDSRFGDYSDLAAFIKEAHNLGLKVLFDLVLNHTSVAHPWFKSHPEYYCWSDTSKESWRNLFDGGPAWERTLSGRYYLHLFAKGQADLNWFPMGGHAINMALVHEFQDIVDFWQELYYVDGFHLDTPQALNKNLSSESLQLTDLISGDGKDIDVIKAVFEDRDNLFLITGCIDPTNGNLIEKYYCETSVLDFISNISLKDEVEKSEVAFTKSLEELCGYPVYMLELESHDTIRFLSRNNLTPEDMIWRMFNSEAKCICLYQGQELCLKSNTYAPIPMDEYEKQEQNSDSYLNLTKTWIRKWKRRG